MTIKWWPWGFLTLICLVLLGFFVLYPLATLFSNSVLNDEGNFSLQAFVQLMRDSDYVKAFWNIVNWADVSARFEAARSGAQQLIVPGR